MKKLVLLFFSVLILFADNVFIKSGCYLCPSANAIYKIVQVAKYSPADARALARDYNCYITTRPTKVELASQGSLNKVYIEGYGYLYTTYNCFMFSK